MIKTSLSWMILIGLIFCPLHAAASAEPPAQVVVRNTTEKVFATLRADREGFLNDKIRLYTLVDETIFPHFDFMRMSRRVLGKYWKKASPEQQMAFVDQFQHLLLRTYATALAQYTDEVIKFLPLKQRKRENEVSVRTEVTQSGGRSIPISYEMYLIEDAWKVFDISIDGVSLVINYRSTFRTEIRRNGMDALLQRLADHNQNK